MTRGADGKGDTPLVSIRGLSKSYGAVLANKDISLDIRAGRIKALLGENGAGKSTLMSMVAGTVRPDAGTLLVRGREARFSSAKESIRAGIGMVYQHFMLVEAMSVSENVVLGQEGGFRFAPGRSEEVVGDLARQYSIDVDPGARVSDLSMGEKQRVEILKLLYRQSEVLIFDEPTAVLTPGEVDKLFQTMRRMAAQNKAVVFISHKLDEVMSVADEIAILRKGRVVDELPVAEVSSKAELARRMVGREIMLRVERIREQPGTVVLRVDGLSGHGLDRVDLELRKGEVLALVGVAGNGQKALVEIVCGLQPPGSGSVEVLGQPWGSFYSRREWKRSLSYIPEDRKGLATCPNLDLVENFLITTRGALTRGMWLQRAKAVREAREWMGRFNVDPPEPGLLARQLSGGNLQKLVLAREFYRVPHLIVAEQPSQGLDIMATEEVWSHLNKARERAGVLLVTGGLTEALSLADRIAVMFKGRIVASFNSEDREQVDNIGLYMAGVSP